MHFGHHRSVALKATVVLASAMSFTLGAAGANAQELTGTLKKIKETGEITIGYRDASVPFSYLDGDQKPVGYAFEICKKIAEAVKTNLKLTKLEVRLNPVTSATRIPLIANGTVDLECGFDHEQRRSPEAGLLYEHPLPHRDPLRREEVGQTRHDRGSQG